MIRNYINNKLLKQFILRQPYIYIYHYHFKWNRARKQRMAIGA